MCLNFASNRFLFCFHCVGDTCCICTLSQGGDKLTLSLGGVNSTVVGYAAMPEGAHAEDPSQVDTDDSNMLSQKRCTTPVTVTHFS
jgi:hypothetical protein